MNDNKEILENDQPAIEEDITPQDLLKFAKIILFFLALIFIIGMVCEVIKPGNNVFEACKTIVPPFGTLIIGYYFGKSN